MSTAPGALLPMVASIVVVRTAFDETVVKETLLRRSRVLSCYRAVVISVTGLLASLSVVFFSIT